MRSAVDRILAGEFNKDNHFLEFSTQRIELSVQSGEICEGSFFIYGAENRVTQGHVLSNMLRMQCLVPSFIGSREEISYRFDASGMEAGETLKGEFCIISNQGEYSIPYEVTIEDTAITSSLGEIKNLFHFANLAKTSFDEAVNLFYSKEFEKVFRGPDRQYEMVYRGLSGGAKSRQNVEEFLLEIKKKQKVEFLLEETEIRIDVPLEDMEYKIAVSRNGWGFSELTVETEGDFLVVEKEILRDEDFLGNTCQLPFYIARDRLHGGRNYAEIRLHNAYTDLKVSVLVHTPSLRSRIPGMRMRKKHLIMELMQYYEAFRTKKISAASWMQETEKIIDSLVETDNRDASSKLLQVQLLITRERYHEAEWLLEQAHAMLEGHFDAALYCYYLYLTTLIHKEEAYVDEIAGQVERIYTQNGDNWRIAWLLLYLSEDYSKSPSSKWMVLEEQIKLGATSPVLYIEAWNLIAASPTLLMKLEEFELQVLTYAARRELLNALVAEQIAYLAMNLKVYSERVYRLLTACYQAAPGDEILRAICTLLIKGNKAGKEYFPWYALGIERELRITRLYEYYMMSVELSDRIELPKMVLMYFAFDSSLDSTRNAFLYAYVHKNKEKYPELYESYREQIERFVVFQLLKGRNNQWLSYLYSNLITEGMVTEETAKGIAEAVFLHRLLIKRGDIRRVIVVYEKQKKEIAFDVTGKEVFLPVYGSDCRIFLEDGRENRYCREEDYELERLMHPDALAGLAAPYLTENVQFDLWMCERGRSLAVVNDDNVEAMKRIAAGDILHTGIQKEIRMKLVYFFYDNDRMQELDSFLAGLTPDMASSGNYAEMVRFMVIRGRYEQAYEWVKKRGGHGIDVKCIMRLCSRLIAFEMAEPDEVMTSLVYMAFQAGKYDDNLLNYLTEHYNGTVKAMGDIWKAAEAFCLDTCKIAERILVQLLYTGAYLSDAVEIYKSYEAGLAGADIEMAFLAQSCYDYFVQEKVTEDYIMEELLRVLERQEELPFVCRLAFTRYYAENKKKITPQISIFLTQLLKELISAGVCFPYFKEYAENLAFMRQFADKTMIQYRAEKGGKAVLHYLVEKSGEDYITEEMQDMFEGIYVKTFVLFFGEKLQYYITENCEGKEYLTESGTLNRSDTDREQKESKYSLINDIAIGRTLDDENTMGKLLHEYFEQEYVVKKLFHIL